MPVGLRASDAPLIQKLVGNDQRLLLRLGALLQSRLAVTRAVLEELPRAPQLRDLLMDAGLKTCAPDDFPACAARRGCADLELCLHPADDWRVLAFADEVDNPLLAAGAPAVGEEEADPGLGGVADLLPTLEATVREPVEGLLAARADEERAAALEQLRYAAPPLRLVAELMPMLLADGADLVRERAIGLMLAAGARPVVIDLVRALHAGDAAAIRRLADSIHALPPAQIDLVVAALLAALGRGECGAALVGLCTAIAPHLATHPGLARLLELLLPHARQLSLLPLVRRLRADHDEIDAILAGLAGQGDDLDARLIVLRAHAEHPEAEALIARGVSLLVSPHEEPGDRMALAAALKRFRRDPVIAQRIAAHGTGLLDARESTVYWLLAELCRRDGVPAAVADHLIDVVRAAATRRVGPHLVAILEQQLPALLPADAAVRASLVEPLAELTVRFRDQRSLELIQDVLIGLGPEAIPGLWDLLREHPDARVRRTAATALGALHRVAAGERLAAAVDDLLAIAAGTSEREEKGQLLEIAAELAQLPAMADPDASRRVDDATRGLRDQALAVWGHIAAGPHVDAERRAEILELLLVGITADLPDLPAEETVDPHTQDTTYVLDARLGSHTSSVPVMLAALRRMGASPHLPPPLLRRMVSDLCRQWHRVSTWEVIWGPGNVQDLGATLGALAEAPDFPATLRLQVAEALLPRVGQLHIAASLAAVCTADGGRALGDLAVRAARALMQSASRGRFADDERGDLADVIANFLLIPYPGNDGATVARRLAGLLGSHRTHLSLRSRERLKAGLETCDPAVRDRLAWVWE